LDPWVRGVSERAPFWKGEREREMERTDEIAL
jgi:hypothetical protein